MEKENWKDVLGYEGIYEASNLGKIRSLRLGKMRVLKLAKSANGYLYVNLYKERKMKTCTVHRLVWEAFNGSIPECYDVNHINEDKTDNRLENLNLMTRKQNINWGTRTERCSKRVLQFTLDWKFVREWPSVNECGRNGFNYGAVAACCRNSYSHEENNIYKGFTWMYADDFFKMLPEI